MAAVALSNYQLGDLLGRGASGSVYRALNFLTGETVAIKSISLLSLPASSLPDIMSEIDLLKNLNHANIVKYKGFARDKENLFIVLEYCENGSLQTILKKFGKFPESLVAVYISQVLQGLIYLHEQGVIHRDIKGANILTNKDGSVKLADFGVSSRSALGEQDDNEVVGSPYWMAPEVIEQSGASTASDIWSVGCVVVELLEGKPPYGDLAPMQALWRIVQDESMRVPEGASPIVKDFLYHCFQKDPNLRVSAKKLLRHPWMLSVKKASEPPAPAPQPKISAAEEMEKPKAKDGTFRAPSGGKAQGGSGGAVGEKAQEKGEAGTVRARKPLTVYDEAVQRVQEWNEALNASPKAIGSLRRPAALPQPRKQSVSQVGRQRGESSGPLGLFTLPRTTDALALQPTTSGAIGGGGTSPIGAPPGLLTKNYMVSDVLQRAKESENSEESWDDDFASDITLSKKLEMGHRREESLSADDMNQRTVRPTHTSPGITGSPPPPSHLQFQLKTQSTASVPSRVHHPPAHDVEDYSDMVFGESETGLESKLAQLKLKNKGRRGLMHPDDIHKVPLSPLPKISHPTSSTPSKPASAIGPLHGSPPTLPLPASPRNVSGKSPPSSRQGSLRGRGASGAGGSGGAEAEMVERAMQKYTEDEEEDYEDVFAGQGMPGGVKPALTPTLQLTRRSNSSWHSSEFGDADLDPFAEIDDDFDAEDLEANLLRDKRATLCAHVAKLIDRLVPNAPAGELREGCDELVGLIENAPEMGLEGYFVAQHGMLAVLEVLDSRLSRDVAVRLLKLVNMVVISDVEMLESFCLIGGIPVIIPYTSKKHSLETRLEASIFIQQLTRSALTLQMFISCRGLRILVELLDEDYTLNKTLILSSLEGINSVFELQSPTPRNDFCRMFVREGILDPLSTALLGILKDEEMQPEERPRSRKGAAGGSMTEEEMEEEREAREAREEMHAQVARAVGVLLLFCQVAQADGRVREAFATRTIMIRLLKACEILPRKLLVTAIKAIKHLSTSPQLIEVLQNSNAMDILVGLLGKSIKGSHSNEICSHLFQTIYSMTRLSKTRQEEAASSGIVPLLKRVIQGASPLKQFALPILCDLANAGKGSRRMLWQNGGMKLYLDLLEDPYWRVSALDAILAWMQDETARVEDVLVEKDSSDSLVKCFVQASGVSFEGILDPFLKILRLSPSLTSTISHPPFFTRLSEALDRSSKAVTKLHLLRLTRVVCESHPDRATLLARFGLVEIVERLSRQDSAVLVRELAKEVLPGLLFGGDVPDPAALAVMEDKRERDSTGVRGADDWALRGASGSRREGREPKRGSQLRRTMSENVVSDTQLSMLPPPLPSTVSRATGAGVGARGVGSLSASVYGTHSSGSSHSSRSSLSSSMSSTGASRGRIPFRPGSGRSSPLPPRPSSPLSISTTASSSTAPSRPPSLQAQHAALGYGQPALSGMVPLAGDNEGGKDRPKHKRKISRSQLREVQWQADENGRVNKVRTPAKLAGWTVE